VKEADIQRAILDYLAMRRHFFFRCNTGAYKTEHGSYVRYGTKGAPDIIVVANSNMIGIEVKTPKGILSDDQAAFGEALKAAGGIYLVARSIDDVQALGL